MSNEFDEGSFTRHLFLFGYYIVCMSKHTKSNSHSIYRPSGSTRVSRKRIYRIPNPKMNGGGFFESIFGGAETPNSTETNSANMSITPSSVETPTSPDNVNTTGSVETPTVTPNNMNMSGSVETPTVTPNTMNMSGSVDTPSSSGSVETLITPPDNMNIPESPSGSVDPLSDMSTSTNTISPIDNSLPEVDTKDASASSSIMDTISGAYNAAKDSFTNEVEGAASLNANESSPPSIAESPMDTSSDVESIEKDDFGDDEHKNTEPVIGDLIKLLSDKDDQINKLLGQLESANKNFADANNKLVECLTSKISSEDTLVQSEDTSPMMSAMTSPESEMGVPVSAIGSPESAMSDGNFIGSDLETPISQSSTESMAVESSKGGKTRNRVKKQRRTRRKQIRG